MYSYIGLCSILIFEMANAESFAVKINRMVHAGPTRHHLTSSTAGTTIDLAK